MHCSCTSLFLFTVSVLGSLLCCIAGIFALNGTLELFETYGPVQGRGNPALDPAPVYWFNPSTNVYEPINYNNRGNLVPQVFKGIQYFLIALSALMVISCVIFLYVSSRSKKVVANRAYQGKRNSRNWIGCVGWLSGYLAFLSLIWLVMACFAVLPLVEYVITMQRCWDLASTNWSPGTKEKICIDLVQYGLVFFKETSDPGYALICGPGGNYDPPRGDLEGFCNNYQLNFSLYLASFIGACVTLLGMVLFAMRLVSTFVYLKVRKFENLINSPNGMYENGSIIPFMNGQVHPPLEASLYGNNVANPNYEQNLFSRQPTRKDRSLDSESNSTYVRAGEVMELKQRYYAGRDDGASRKTKRHETRSTSFNSNYRVPPFEENHPPSYHSSARQYRDDYLESSSRRDIDRRRRQERDRGSLRRPASRDDESELLRSDNSEQSTEYTRSSRRRPRSYRQNSESDSNERRRNRRRERRSRDYSHQSYSD